MGGGGEEAGLTRNARRRKRGLDGREAELEKRLEQRAAAMEGEYQVKGQELARREEAFKQRMDERERALVADDKGRQEALERRGQELEKRFEQRLRTLESDYLAKQSDVERRNEELEAQAQGQMRASEAELAARNAELENREREVKKQAEQLQVRARAVTRRDLLYKMQDMVEKQREVRSSPETERKRSDHPPGVHPGVSGVRAAADHPHPAHGIRGGGDLAGAAAAGGGGGGVRLDAGVLPAVQPSLVQRARAGRILGTEAGVGFPAGQLGGGTVPGIEPGSAECPARGALDELFAGAVCRDRLGWRCAKRGRPAPGSMRSGGYPSSRPFICAKRCSIFWRSVLWPVR